MTTKKEAVSKEAAEKSAMPNLEHIVHYVRNSGSWDFTTKEGLCAYMNAVVVALYYEDSGFGHLVKTEGQNHCVDPAGRNCATDVSLYRPTGQVVDFIVSAGYGVPPPPNDVCWNPGPVGEYTSDMWFAPVAGDGEIPPGGGEVPADIQEQLNRIEQKIDEQAGVINEMKLFLSNMNDQMALGFGAVNEIRAHQNPPYMGRMVRDGMEFTTNPQE